MRRGGGGLPAGISAAGGKVAAAPESTALIYFSKQILISKITPRDRSERRFTYDSKQQNPIDDRTTHWPAISFTVGHGTRGHIRAYSPMSMKRENHSKPSRQYSSMVRKLS